MLRHISRRAAVLLALVTMAVVGTATPVLADSGGGCRQTSNAYVCISVRAGTANPLVHDYYIDNRTRGEVSGAMFVQYYNGSYYYAHLYTWIPVAGHSPVLYSSKAGCCRQARTYVNFYNASGSYLYTAYSPWQYW